MVFTVKDNAISPRRHHFANAVKRLPEARSVAHEVGLNHLYGSVESAAAEAGLDTEGLGVFDGRIGIEHSSAGDRLFDAEFGTHKTAPSSVIRNAHRRALPEAAARYSEALQRGVGL